MIGTGVYFFFQAEDGIRDIGVTGVQTCALPICGSLLRHGPAQRGALLPLLHPLLDQRVLPPPAGPGVHRARRLRHLQRAPPLRASTSSVTWRAQLWSRIAESRPGPARTTPAQDSGRSCWTSRAGTSSTVTGAGVAGPKTRAAAVIVPFRTCCT